MEVPSTYIVFKVRGPRHVDQGWEKTKKKRGKRMSPKKFVEMETGFIECLLIICKVLGSIPNTTRKKKSCRNKEN